MASLFQYAARAVSRLPSLRPILNRMARRTGLVGPPRPEELAGATTSAETWALIAKLDPQVGATLVLHLPVEMIGPRGLEWVGQHAPSYARELALILRESAQWDALARGAARCREVVGRLETQVVVAAHYAALGQLRDLPRGEAVLWEAVRCAHVSYTDRSRAALALIAAGPLTADDLAALLAGDFVSAEVLAAVMIHPKTTPALRARAYAAGTVTSFRAQILAACPDFGRTPAEIALLTRDAYDPAVLDRLVQVCPVDAVAGYWSRYMQDAPVAAAASLLAMPDARGRALDLSRIDCLAMLQLPSAEARMGAMHALAWLDTDREAARPTPVAALEREDITADLVPPHCLTHHHAIGVAVLRLDPAVRQHREEWHRRRVLTPSPRTSGMRHMPSRAC
jgi:hypothetical protein